MKKILVVLALLLFTALAFGDPIAPKPPIILSGFATGEHSSIGILIPDTTDIPYLFEWDGPYHIRAIDSLLFHIYESTYSVEISGVPLPIVEVITGIYLPPDSGHFIIELEPPY
ncbi:hypothetical protein JXI42_04630, partial [bacterium]|nr:hypothetical protein [bacterium]